MEKLLPMMVMFMTLWNLIRPMFLERAVLSEPLMDYNLTPGMHCKDYILRLQHCPEAGFRLAYRSGVTTGITHPSSNGFLVGLSTAFNTGLPHRLAKGAIVQDIAALHVKIDSSKPSVSTHIAALRNLLQGGGKGDLAARFEDVVQVSIINLIIFITCTLTVGAGETATSHPSP